MAYRELGVIELREVWRRYSVGEGVRAIARGTGVDRKTIAKYVAAAVAVGLHRGAPPPTDRAAASASFNSAPAASRLPERRCISPRTIWLRARPLPSLTLRQYAAADASAV